MTSDILLIRVSDGGWYSDYSTMHSHANTSHYQVSNPTQTPCTPVLIPRLLTIVPNYMRTSHKVTINIIFASLTHHYFNDSTSPLCLLVISCEGLAIHEASTVDYNLPPVLCNHRSGCVCSTSRQSADQYY